MIKSTVEKLKIGDKLYRTVKVTDDPVSYEMQVLTIKEIDWINYIGEWVKYWLCLDCKDQKHILFDPDLDEYRLSSKEAFEATLERRKNALHLTNKKIAMWQADKYRQEKEIKALEKFLEPEEREE